MPFFSRSTVLPQAPRIALIRFSSLGDVVKCTALPRLIKAWRPAASVLFITLRAHAPLLESNPHVDAVFSLARQDGLGGLRRLAGRLRGWRAHLVLDVHNSLRSRLLRALAPGQPWRVYPKHSGQRFLRIGFGWRGSWGGADKERDFLAPLLPHGVRDDGLGAELHPQALEAEAGFRREFAPALETLAAWRRQGAQVLGLAPHAAWPLKRWPLEHFGWLAQQHLAQPGGRLGRGAGAAICFGGPGEEAVGRLADSLGPRCLNLVGRTTPLQSAFFARQVHGLVAGDTAMVHIAEAAGRPVLALFGPTSRELGYAPSRPQSRILERPLPCRPCTSTGKGRCRHPWPQACLQGLSREQAWQALQELLDRAPPLPPPGAAG